MSVASDVPSICAVRVAHESNRPKGDRNEIQEAMARRNESTRPLHPVRQRGSGLSVVHQVCTVHEADRRRPSSERPSAAMRAQAERLLFDLFERRQVRLMVVNGLTTEVRKP
jgi:hypothetical protein